MAKKKAARRRPLKKIAKNVKTRVKARRTRRKKRRATVMGKIKKALGM